jgi:hypothetical protein
VTRFGVNGGRRPRSPSQPISEEEVEKLDQINDDAAAKVRRDYESGKNSPSLSEEIRPERSQQWKSTKTPRLLKAVLFVGISGLGLLGIRILPATASEGWIHFIALLAALGLIVAALREVTRNK